MKVLRDKISRAQERGLNWTVSVFGMVLLSSLFAVAGEGEKKDTPTSEPNRDQAVLAVTLERFRQQCQDPSKSEVQRAPQDIKMVCRNHEVTWIAAIPGEIPLKSERVVSTAIVSDKFRVAEVSKQAPSISLSGVCQRYQEVVEDYAVEVPVSCSDLLNEKQNVDDLCASHIDESKDKNESAIQVKATGRVIDTCVGLVNPQR